MKIRYAIVFAAATFGLAACQQPVGPRTSAEGAAVGAVGGAALGQAIGRDTRSTITGAGLGAVAGGLATAHGEQQRAQAQQPRAVAPR